MNDYDDAKEMIEELTQRAAAQQKIAIEFHPPKTTYVLGHDGASESFEPAWVKVSVSLRDGLMARLKGAPLAVMFSIGLHIGTKGSCYPSIPTICKETGYSPPTVIEAIKKLEHEFGLFRAIRTPGKSTVYEGIVGFAFGKDNDPSAFNPLNNLTRKAHLTGPPLNQLSSPPQPVKPTLPEEEEEDVQKEDINYPRNYVNMEEELTAPDGAEPVYVDLDELEEGHSRKYPKWKVANDYLDRRFLQAAHPGRKFFDSNAIRKKWKKVRLRMGADPTMPAAFVDYVLDWAAGMGTRGKPIGTQGIITALTEGRAFARWQKERKDADTEPESYNLEEQRSQSTDASAGYDLASMRDMQRRRAGTS